MGVSGNRRVCEGPGWHLRGDLSDSMDSETSLWKDTGSLCIIGLKKTRV